MDLIRDITDYKIEKEFDLFIQETFDFTILHDLVVELNMKDNSEYLSYLIAIENGTEQRCLIPITKKQKKLLNSNKISVRGLYKSASELYVVNYSLRHGLVVAAFKMQFNIFDSYHKIDKDYRILKNEKMEVKC